ncbi:SET domain-containing protein-lysine N-methyltransferase [Paraburkholderia sp. DGU8]|uniref:SET domain-containing protein-lysine N-methyltransferase n=1 Tax=Paraburkholderia sp. DGU8 TaxID=3161997 RepID=UPI003465046E
MEIKNNGSVTQNYACADSNDDKAKKPSPQPARSQRSLSVSPKPDIPAKQQQLTMRDTSANQSAQSPDRLGTAQKLSYLSPGANASPFPGARNTTGENGAQNRMIPLFTFSDRDKPGLQGSLHPQPPGADKPAFLNTSIVSRNRREADTTVPSLTHSIEPGSIDHAHPPLNQTNETSVASGNTQTFTIFGTNEVLQPSSSYSLPQREKRVEDYTRRVKTRIAEIESGSEAQRNVNFLNARAFLTPLGYFSGGLMAAGYDPHERITVAFPHFVHPPGGFKHQDRVDERTYEAWEIAAGVLEHDRPEKGGILASSDTKIAAADHARIKDLESLGTKLQAHWEQDVSEPMRGYQVLAIRSGKADAYAVRATLQGLQSDRAAFKQLSPEGQQAISRTLDKNGQVIIPNVYGYPLAGHAFIPYKPYEGNDENRPNQGLMMDLNRGSVSEIHGDDDFAWWAKNNRGNLLQSFNDSDRQGGRDAHWPKADEALDKLIAGNEATYYGYKNLVSDQRIPVRELFNYTRSRGGDYQLKYGNLTAGAGDNDETGIASQYQVVNANNARWADQTEVFGAAQRNWKSAKEFWGNTFSYLPIVGGVGGLVFGVHDGLHGLTEQDRVGGNAGAIISGLNVVHDLAPGLAESTFGKSPSVFNSSSIRDTEWKLNPGTSEFKFTPPQRVNGQVGYPLGPIEPPRIPGPGGTEMNVPNAGNRSPQPGPSGIKRPAPSGDNASGPVDATEASPRTKISRPDNIPGTTASSSNSSISKAGPSSQSQGNAKKYSPVTADHINKWCDMPQAERDKIGMAEFARRNNLSSGSWVGAVTANGKIRARGQAIRDCDHATRAHYSPITTELINEWRTMPQAERDKIGRVEFARDRNLSLESWQRSVNADGTVKPRGQAILDRDRATRAQYSPVTAELINDWCAMPQAERNKIGSSQFARDHNLSLASWQHAVNADGTVRPGGQATLDRATGVQHRRPTADLIKKWHDMPQAERGKTGMAKFARDNNLSFNTWRSSVGADGTIRPQGQAILDRTTGAQYGPVTADLINKWCAMPQAERDKIGMARFASDNSVRFISWRNAVAADGTIRQYGQLVLNRKLKEGPSVGENITIKTEPYDPGFIRHEIDDNGPILRSPADPARSVLQEAEGPIDRIAVTNWADLREEFANLPASEQKRVKQEIVREVHEWLRSEGNHKGKFEDLIDLRIPLDDGPNRGMSAYARRDIRQFEVIGPYAGVLHDTDASLAAEMAKLGDERVLTYLWSTNSGRRSVSGFTHGNTLSLINTSQLPGASAEASLAKNNLGAIRVGKNLTFYVALKEIRAGDELLVNYGDEYNPSGSWRAADEPVSEGSRSGDEPHAD